VKSVRYVTSARLPTRIGEFKILGYHSLVSNEEFVCIIKGELRHDVPTLVRIHSQCLTGDVFGSIKCDCGLQLRRSMEIVEREGRGVIVYQLQDGRGIGVINKIRAYALQDQGADTIEANRRLGFADDLRDYKQCVEILVDLGLRQVRPMSNNPEKLAAMEAGGLCVVERVPLEVEPPRPAIHYLRTKKIKMGHLLELVN
jgi:3,4-dihydroxy 2-butanone 4-phosphate synthase/GTP cyclohydrolase II